jgi:hypothetical protein
MVEPNLPRPLPGPRSGPAHAAIPEQRGPSRRWFLAGGAVVLLGGGAGVAADLVHEKHHGAQPPPLPPAALAAAAAAERVLIADLAATTGGSPSVRRVIVQARADHAAHLDALTDLLAFYRAPSVSPSAHPGTARTHDQLRAAEQQASIAAAGHAASLSGAQAALLASIAACEASHAELLR